MIKFGPSGNSDSFYNAGYKHTTESAQFVRDHGLDLFEYSFGRGVRMTDATARDIKNAFDTAGVEISVHAPYFINFANPEEEKAVNSYNYVIQSLDAMVKMGGKRCVIHPATQGKMERRDAVGLMVKRMAHLVEIVEELGYRDIYLCPETMGKIGQIGTVDEILEVCKLSSVYIPTIDFGHLNARTHGGVCTKDDYKREIDKVYNAIGEDRASKIHVHFSKIEYSQGGEVKHLTFEDKIYGPDYEPLMSVFYEYGMSPFIVCESAGTQLEDAMAMKSSYMACLSK
ncbi:MAG: TIM barrel protein [Clostridia bacterium]|nr:TIM barrel protein [Clostridia bacterium]